MFGPKTRQEAEAYRYGTWAGEPKGRPYDSARCACPVWDMMRQFQCSRRAGHGPENLFCKQHAKLVK